MRFNSSHTTDSLGSRRPARASLPPFTLPPPPEIPRAGAFAADGLSPATGGVRSAGESSSHSTSTSALSSPGYSVAAMSSYGSPRQASNQPYSSQHPSGSRFHGSPGRLQQPLAPKPPPPPKQQRQQQQQSQLSPGLPLLPTSPSGPAGFGEKLPPISSLIPRSPPGPSHPSHYGSSRPQMPSSGHLARPMGTSLVTNTIGGPPPTFYRTPTNTITKPAVASTGHYLEFNVGMGAYSVVRESSQQDRPFKCDMCTQCFSRNHDLKRHKRIHLAAKPFPCPQCQKCFSRKDALKRHSLVKACGGKKKKGLGSTEGEKDGDQDEEMEEARADSGGIGQENQQQSSDSKSPSPTGSASTSADNIDADVDSKAKPESRPTDRKHHDVGASNDGGRAGVPGG